MTLSSYTGDKTQRHCLSWRRSGRGAQFDHKMPSRRLAAQPQANGPASVTTLNSAPAKPLEFVSLCTLVCRRSEGAGPAAVCAARLDRASVPLSAAGAQSMSGDHRRLHLNLPHYAHFSCSGSTHPALLVNDRPVQPGVRRDLQGALLLAFLHLFMSDGRVIARHCCAGGTCLGRQT